MNATAIPIKNCAYSIGRVADYCIVAQVCARGIGISPTASGAGNARSIDEIVKHQVVGHADDVT